MYFDRQQDANKGKRHVELMYQTSRHPHFIICSVIEYLLNFYNIRFVFIQAEFNTKANTRTTVVLNLDRDFHGSIMGRPVRDENPDWTSMHSIGITLSLRDVHGMPADKETFHDGPFAITLHSITLEYDSVSTPVPDL